jgi:hypothetical protein
MYEERNEGEEIVIRMTWDFIYLHDSNSRFKDYRLNSNLKDAWELP